MRHNENQLRELSVVIPAYNEAARIGKTLELITEYLAKNVARGEVIVVDDGSFDDTVEVARSFHANPAKVTLKILSNQENRGKGYSVRHGLLSATTEVGLFTDADLSTPISEASKLVRPIENGELNIAIGSRAVDRSLIGVRQTWRREQSGKIFNLAVRVVTGLPIWDTQCGFKAFGLSVCRPILEGAVIDGFAFDVELLTIAHLANLHISEIPVRWDHYDGSTVSMTRDSVRMLNEVRRIRREVDRGSYSEAISAARTAAMVEAKHIPPMRSHR